MKRKYVKNIITKITCAAMAIGIAFFCATPVKVQAADEFAGGSIVVDPEKPADEGKRYVPETYILRRNGLKERVEKFTYDKKGRIINVKIDEYNYDYDYDKEHNVIADDYKISKYEYGYKYTGDKLVERTEKWDGRLMKKTKYIYDGDKLKYEQVCSGGDESDRELTKYKYNKNGKLYAKYLNHLTRDEETGKYYISDDVEERRDITYKYDSEGRIRYYQNNYGAGHTHTAYYKYNKHGDLRFYHWIDEDGNYSKNRYKNV